MLADRLIAIMKTCAGRPRRPNKRRTLTASGLLTPVDGFAGHLYPVSARPTLLCSEWQTGPNSGNRSLVARRVLCCVVRGRHVIYRGSAPLASSVRPYWLTAYTAWHRRLSAAARHYSDHLLITSLHHIQKSVTAKHKDQEAALFWSPHREV